MDHCRDDRRGGGIGLICRDSLRVKKVEAGVKDSFEFTEWTVRTLGHIKSPLAGNISTAVLK